MKAIDPAEAVKAAKTAVEGLDEPYKMEAFKLILQRLMSGGGITTEEVVVPATRNGNAKRSRRSSRRPSGRADAGQPKPKSTLDLSVEELNALKAFYETYVVKGGEMCAFVIAAYLRSKKKMDNFTQADIEYCYQQLISLKAQVPVIKDMYVPMVWLVAPSRKKGWLRKIGGDHFEFTSAGLIALNALPKAQASAGKHQ